jgi:Flp pilus assembly protein TadB
MRRIDIYIALLIGPTFIYSLIIIKNELIRVISVLNYSKQQKLLTKLLQVITRSQMNYSELNQELAKILQMLAIMISAGESPVTALRYISQRSSGKLALLIKTSLGNYEQNGNLYKTLEFVSSATNSAQVRRLLNAVRISAERGSPMLDTLQNQVRSLNKEIKVNLLNRAGKSEIALLIPVVFLILPTSILFAVWPSIYGLSNSGY